MQRRKLKNQEFIAFHINLSSVYMITIEELLVLENLNQGIIRLVNTESNYSFKKVNS